MSERIIEMEADSVEEARKRLYTDDLIIIQETILRRERTGAIEAVADTIRDADVETGSKIPVGAKIEKRIVKVEPKQSALRVKASNEETARKEVVPKAYEQIETVILHKKGRRGFLGIGKRPNVYEVTVVQKAVVEIRFRERARLQAKVQDYSAENLLHTLQDLRQRNAQRSEVFQQLNPKNVSEIRVFLDKLAELSPPLGLDAIEVVCLDQSKMSWANVIKEAHYQAVIARAKELARLRGLDVEIADIFGFYTSIDWNENSYKEPTGIPRDEYGGGRVVNDRDRRVIPRYTTDVKAFLEVDTRVKRIKEEGLYDLFLQFLIEDGHDERTATLEQKCMAIIKARKRKLKVGA